MIDPVKVKDMIARITGESFEVVQKYETIDAMYGMEHRILTDEDIEALKEGKYLYSDDGEYAQIISYVANMEG
jgi:hypothetical protein